MQEKIWDVVIIGGGLSGLSAGLHLQQRKNLEILILEKRPSLGGLCASAMFDGFEFPIGCNDFPNHMLGLIRQLQIPIPFLPSKTSFVRKGRHFQFPPNRSMLRLLLRRFPDLWRFWRGTRKDQVSSLENAGRRFIKDETLRDILSILAYSHGLSGEDLGVEWLQQEKEMGYQHHKMWNSVGGPQSLIAELARAFHVRGASLLEAECHGIEHLRIDDAELKLVRTARGDFKARQVIATIRPPTAEFTPLKEGMACNMIFLAVRKTFAFPKGLHALVHYPPQAFDWLKQLDQGIIPQEFGFHFFHTDYSENRDYSAVNILALAPRGRELSKAESLGIERYILDHAEALAPGLKAAILYKKSLSAPEYEERFGLSSRAVRSVAPAGFRKPENYDSKLGIYRAGTDVYPPGDHAGAAFLSGKVVADLILSRESFT